jgi:hypothetical protein
MGGSATGQQRRMLGGMPGNLHARTDNQTIIVTTFRYMEKKPWRQGDVILNVIVGIYKQKAAYAVTQLLRNCNFSEVSEAGHFALSNFPGWDERTGCEESECKVVTGESKVQLH